jgi:hypothetical protein
VGVGGCHDHATDSERVRQAVFCAKYFVARIRASPWTRVQSMWRSLRCHILNRRALSSRKLGARCVSFASGLWYSTGAKPRLGLESTGQDSLAGTSLRGTRGTLTVSDRPLRSESIGGRSEVTLEAGN